MGGYEWRDVRPDGTVLAQWLQPPGAVVELGPHERPQPPWDRQCRELPDGGWVTVALVREDGMSLAPGQASQAAR